MLKRIVFSAVLFFTICDPLWALPECDDSIHWKDWDNCKGKMTQTNGEIYVGDWKNGKKHGDGIFNFSNGSKYSGKSVPPPNNEILKGVELIIIN